MTDPREHLRKRIRDALTLNRIEAASAAMGGDFSAMKSADARFEDRIICLALGSDRNALGDRRLLICPQGSSPWTTIPPGQLLGALEPMEEGEVMEVKWAYMSDAEIEALDEFTGW